MSKNPMCRSTENPALSTEDAKKLVDDFMYDIPGFVAAYVLSKKGRLVQRIIVSPDSDRPLNHFNIYTESLDKNGEWDCSIASLSVPYGPLDGSVEAWAVKRAEHGGERVVIINGAYWAWITSARHTVKVIAY